ncbi:exported protein of unknown function [Hyphomicrobium sp. 1Nfss2.1]
MFGAGAKMLPLRLALAGSPLYLSAPAGVPGSAFLPGWIGCPLAASGRGAHGIDFSPWGDLSP